MTEPITSNRSLIVPNTGDLSGAWGTSALNPNFQTLDALVGGSTTISLSSATTVLLSVPATTGVWVGSLSQSVQSIIFFTGAQTGNAVIQFTLPGYYIVHNKCTGTSYVQLANQSGSGNKIGAPPGKKCHVFFDGTDMDYVNAPDPATAYDLHTNTTTLPPWMQACTVAPYLLKDGSTYSASVYPALFQQLGSTFGGNGITTFGVPDERNRMRIPVDTGSNGRLSGSGISGTTFASSGGTATMTLVTGNLPPYTPSGTVAVTANSAEVASSLGAPNNGIATGPQVGAGSLSSIQSLTLAFTGVAQGGSSTPTNNMVPSVVSFLALIKT